MIEQNEGATQAMNLIFRLLLVIWRANRASKLKPLDTSEVQFRVLPTDLDIFMHMNNGLYLTLMDLGRMDILVRSGFFAVARKRGWYPVVGTATIEYKKSLQLFDRYTIATRMIRWDDRWFYIEQQFIKGDRVAATATIKAMMRSKEGIVTPQEALAAINYHEPSPAETIA
jgi:YbgC/YbaW family acyl-CoA thioester hydrolase